MSDLPPPKAISEIDERRFLDDMPVTAATQEYLPSLHLDSTVDTVQHNDDDVEKKNTPFGLLVQKNNPLAGVNRESDLLQIDVVHVMALCPEIERHGIEHLLYTSLRGFTREFIFRLDIRNLLAGNLVQEYIEQQATRLLRGLVAKKPKTKRAIILVAYDLGALVVKTAVYLAAILQDTYSSIFFDVARVVFSGCPQRSVNAGEMAVLLHKLLHDNTDKALCRIVYPDSTANLAHAAIRTTGMLISSKITLCSRIISLYANDSQAGGIDSSLNVFTATLGVTSEIGIEEQCTNDLATRFPTLSFYLSRTLKDWVLRPDRVPVAQTLHALSVAQKPSTANIQQRSAMKPGLDAQGHMDWAESSNSQILYVHGTSYHASHDMADEVLYAWKDELRSKLEDTTTRSLSFTFDSTDPLRDSVSDMVVSVLAQAFAGQDTDSVHEVNQMFQDLFIMRSGWTEMSSLIMLESTRLYWLEFDTILLLHNFDECKLDSRLKFLEYYTKLSHYTEFNFKLVITSRKPNSLLGELKEWHKLDVDQFEITLESKLHDVEVDLICLCPIDSTRKQIQKHLERLQTMERSSFLIILQLLRNHTGWPEYPSQLSLSSFVCWLDRVLPSDTPKRVLQQIFCNYPDLDALLWSLNWLLCGHRPLSCQELVAILRHRYRSYSNKSEFLMGILSAPSSMETQRQLESWLRVVADFSNNEVTIRLEVLDLLEDTGSDCWLWDEVRQKSHQDMVDFCYAYLGLPTTVETLYTIFRQYKSRLDKQQQSHKITAPITSDGQEIAFYVVQALPYHLQSFQPGDSSNSLRFFFEKSTSSSSMLWAKIYWGMSNPMSRTPDPPNSPLSVLFGLGLLSQEAMKEKDEALQAEHVVAAVANGRGNEVAMFFEQRSSMLSVYMDVLVVAVQANDEHNARKALDAAKSVPPNSEWDPTTPTWPDHVIWAATWLNMANLVETLIGNRVDPNHGEARDTSTGSAIRFFPSLIYMASRLGHASIVKKLLDRNANANILIEGASGSFQTAANGGHTEVLRVFVAHDRSHLRSRLPDTALFSASAWGNWRSVVELLELGSHPDDAPDPSDDDPPRWTPLAAACSKAAPRTVETLLNYKANPNIIGANGVATPLWFSAVNVPNDECVRAMLRHGANPNHEQFKQPLLNAVVCSSHKVDTIVSICNALLNGRQPINVNAFDSSGVTALMLAAELEELPVVRWLLNNGADVNMLDDQNRSAIYYAVSAGSTTAVEELLKFGPNLACLHTSVKQPILATAIRNPQILEILLRTGVDLDLADADGCTAINEASTQGVTDAVKLLIEKGADINHTDNQGWSPICDAVGYVHNPAMVRLLADHGAKLDVTMEDKSLLHLALGGPPDILKTLLEFRKALDINAKDKKKCTALHVAADCSYTEHLKILLRAGADVNARDIAEETPLHKAARDSNSDALSCLLREPDMEVNSIAPKEDSPLHIACRWLNFKGVRTLLCHGANVHVASANSFCSTPLMAALLSYHGPDHEDAATIDVIARTLVFHRASENAGANVQQEVHGSRFYTALSAACLGASVRTLNFLLEQGASAQVRDPVSGRFPHHFAAANGIDNFRSIMLSYNDDMMVSDKAGKNCIHWAAQFGNLNTILFILARLRDTGSQERVMQYINQPDSDGWTPLCWAARPWPNTLFEWTRSEKRDFAGVIRTLLENGANRTVQCALGNGWVIERPDILTPLELARWCKADDDVINLLRYGVEGESRPRDEESSQPVRRYVLHTITCDICLNFIFGLVFSCNSCADYNVCTKCLSHVKTFHTKETQRDDEEHRFALDSELREYRDPPLPFPLGGEKDIELWFDAQGQRLEAKPDQTGDLWNSEDLDGIEMDSDIIDMDWTA